MTASDILRRVAAARGIPLSRIFSRYGCKSVKVARHEAMYLIRRHTNLSFMEIGHLMRRDHSTVVVAVRKVEIDIEFHRGDAYEAELDRIVAPVSFADALKAA